MPQDVDMRRSTVSDNLTSSPRSMFKQPISLLNLFTRLSESDCTCIGFPYPFKSGCRQDGRSKGEDLRRQRKRLQNVLENGQYPGQLGCVKSLLDIANNLLCEKHAEYGVVFVYRWLAETFLPDILKEMGWELNLLTWTCLGSQQGQMCEDLECRQQRVDLVRSYSFLRSSTVGESVHAEGAFRTLIEHCLCRDHRGETKSLTQKLLSRVNSMLTLNKNSDANMETFGAVQSVDSSNTNDSPVLGERSDSNSVNDKVDSIDARNRNLNPQGALMPNREELPETPARKAFTDRASSGEFAPAIVQPSEGDYFTVGSKSFSTNCTENVSAAKSPPVLGSSSIPFNPQTPQTHGSTPESLLSSPRPFRGRTTSMASTRGSSLLSQEMTPNDMDSDTDSSFANLDSSPSTAGSTPQSAASSVPPPSPGRKRAVSQDACPGETHDSPSKKQRGNSTPRMDSASSNKRNGENPYSLDFEPSNSNEEPLGATVQKIFQKIKKDIPQPNGGASEGYIYVFRVVGRPGVVKIGITQGAIETRLKQVQSCTKYELEVLGTLSPTLVPVCKRVEELIHMDLRNERHFFKCKCKQKQKRHHSTASDGLTKHGEWFAIGELEAMKTVERWTQWALQKPYNADGILKEEWQRNRRYCETHPDYFTKTVPAEENNNERWKSFMNGAYDHSLFRREFLDDRPGKQSRWVSIQNDWKENVIFWFSHALISLSIYTVAQSCQANTAIMLVPYALFPLFSIWYSA